MKTADFSKLFLAIFERTYDGLYISYFLWLQHVSIKRNDQRRNFALPHLKRTLESGSNQKCVKCFMKAPISQVLLQTSLLIVQFSKSYLKTLSWNFFFNERPHSWVLCNLFQVFHQLAFKFSID